MATAAVPAYLETRGRPSHPGGLLEHDCFRIRFRGGALPLWEFQDGREVVTLDPQCPLVVQAGGGVDLAIEAAIAGCGVVHLFEDWSRRHLEVGALEPVLIPWRHRRTRELREQGGREPGGKPVAKQIVTEAARYTSTGAGPSAGTAAASPSSMR